MNIVIKSKQGKNIRIPLPSVLVFNRFTAGLMPKYLKQNGLDISKKQARVFVKELHRFRRRHRDWVLVEVQSASGDYVKIKL